MTAVLRPSLSTVKNGPERRFVDVQYKTSQCCQGVVPDDPRVK